MEEFEDRLEGLLKGDRTEVLATGISAASVIGGAKRRRTKYRTAVAGSSFAVLAVAAGAGMAFGGGAGSPASGYSTPLAGGATSTTGSPKCVPQTTQSHPTPPPGGYPAAQIAKAIGTTYPLASGTIDGRKWSLTVGIMHSVRDFAAAHPELLPHLDLTYRPDMPAAWVFTTTDGVTDSASLVDLDPNHKDQALPFQAQSAALGTRNCDRQWPEMVYFSVVSPETDHLQVTYTDHSDKIPAVTAGDFKFVAVAVQLSDHAKTIALYDASGHELAHQAASPYLDPLPPAPVGPADTAPVSSTPTRK